MSCKAPRTGVGESCRASVHHESLLSTCTQVKLLEVNFRSLYSSAESADGEAGVHEPKLWPLRLRNSAVRGASSWPHLWLIGMTYPWVKYEKHFEALARVRLPVL